MFEGIKKVFQKNSSQEKNSGGEMSASDNLSLAQIRMKNSSWGYSNLAEGSGTSQSFDSYASRRNPPYLTYQHIDAMYRSNWMARKIINTPASDMTRKWRRFLHEDPNIIDIRDKAEKRYRVKDVVRRAVQWADLYGGSAITLNISGQDDLSAPIDYRNIKKGSLLKLEVVFKDQITPSTKIDIDPMSPGYETPESYTISGTKGLQIHESRVVQFYGSELPLYAMLRQNSWGDSKLTAAWSVLEIAEKTWLNISQLISKSNIDVIQIEDYLNLLARDGDLFSKVVGMQKSMISNYRTMIIDSKQKFERNELSGIAGLAEVMIQFLQMVSGAAGMPLSKFLGTSVGGFSTGDNEVREYYDSINEGQNRIEDQLQTLDKIIEISVFGEFKGIDFAWNPLQEITEEQIADLQLKRAQRDQINISMGVVDEVIVAQSLMKDNTYPSITQEWIDGLDIAVDDVDPDGGYNENTN